ncbi:MAG TPA: nucleotidyltransferase domain-containing protein [Ktedonosporobacter sp.]|nr:nucleotidyltransferase domain-containing protein [Ktedonosporobacter sp.]
MRPVKVTKTIPAWLDKLTSNLIMDIIDVLAEQQPDLLAVILYGSVARHDERPLGANPSDVDLLAIFDSEDVLLAVNRGDSLSHTVGQAYCRHLDAPREVQVMFASRDLQEWDPTFIANVACDGIVLFQRRPIPTVLEAHRGRLQRLTGIQ